MSRVAVEIGAIEEARGGTLAMHGLGSCVGLFFVEPGIVGLAAHILLPEPLPSSRRGREARDVESAVAAMLKRARRLGMCRPEMDVFLTGGAQVIQFEGTRPPTLEIGRRNVDACEAALGESGTAITRSWTGGRHPYSVSLDVDTGEMTVRQVRMALAINGATDDPSH